MTLLAFDRVAIQLGGREILSPTSFEVGRGEFVCIVGASGCGKTTLLRAAAGLVRASAGSVRRNGQAVTAPSREVAFVFQDYGRALLPWRTVAGNVALALEAAGLPREQHAARIAGVLQKVGLARHADKFPAQLSGGMQQRAQLCRALIHEPSLLMLDEPFGALDMFTREELWLALQDLWLARRPTVILVTHDLREAVFLADRVLVMSARPGRIILDRKIPTPRPRRLDSTCEPESVALVHELREHISAARAQAAA